MHRLRAENKMELERNNSLVVGIDTSNYTTSVGILTLDGELVANLKRPLPVKEGERGLRQSDAVFAHVKNLPELMQQAAEFIGGRRVVAIGVSEKPRNSVGSYMPCFLVGVAAAETASGLFNSPLFRFSHQCGHIMSVLYACGREPVLGESFGAFHVSGGTTELVLATPDDNGFVTEIIGGTKDLNAGQVIDRIAVAMGLPFPGGAHLEKYASEFTGKLVRRRPPMDGCFVNLSGLENLALNTISSSQDKSMTAAFVLDYIGSAMEGMSRAFIEKYGDRPLVYAGGVMSNGIIRERLQKRFDCCFGPPSLSADNAVGIAALARRAYLKSH